MGYAPNGAGHTLWHDITLGYGLTATPTPTGYVLEALTALRIPRYEYAQLLIPAVRQTGANPTWVFDTAPGVEVTGAAAVYRNGLLQESSLGASDPTPSIGYDYALTQTTLTDGSTRYTITPNNLYPVWGDGDKVKALVLVRTER